ncbi:acyl-CoA dehydrogenase [Pseudonocardia bannensis]|uniref:Acyl-CoA dehydrogenase n=2 Tax=Pseudonocardia bannensis TaxID=630973 RepID=A0A848DC73_9PSEU|nr:acyl-CoA dehydrogenase [Pseudonocardia bannensis]
MTTVETTVADLRTEVRRFLADELAAGSFRPSCDSWIQGHSAEFSRKLGDRGWLGMTWPQRYGGGGRSARERFTVIEELLAAGAPVAAHWIADRQTGPLLLRVGTEQQKQAFLPAMARGRLFIAAGMSEPDSGSDLASVRTRAVPTATGWRVNGRKVWTSHAHRSHYLLALVRTAAPDGDRHAGLSQMLIKLDAPGVHVRPIEVMTGEAHFTEVILDDVDVPQGMVVGAVGDGWRGVMSELAHERSGPERYLSTFPLFAELVAGRTAHGEAALADIGSATARLWALRALSVQVQDLIERRSPTDTAAALVKDLGTRLEGEIIDITRRACRPGPDPSDSGPLRTLLSEAQLAAPSFTLRGGTNEILRGLVARGLGA